MKKPIIPNQKWAQSYVKEMFKEIDARKLFMYRKEDVLCAVFNYRKYSTPDHEYISTNQFMLKVDFNDKDWGKLQSYLGGLLLYKEWRTLHASPYCFGIEVWLKDTTSYSITVEGATEMYNSPPRYLTDDKQYKIEKQFVLTYK